MAAALCSGYPQGLVEKTAADRIAAVEGRRDGIIGTNLHPNLREKLPTAAPAKPVVTVPGAVTAKPIILRRRAEPFEALRRRTAAAHPKVFLATFGPRKQHGPRAEFSAGFFAAGGFEAVSAKASDTPEAAAQAALASGAPVVVLCSTDETYPMLVPPCAQALKAAAQPPVVVLAGLPATPELQAQFKSAGVDEFIHVRANCAKVLAGILNQIGL